MTRWLNYRVLCPALCLVTFVSGVLIGVYKLPPYDFRATVKNTVMARYNSSEPARTGRDSLLDLAFSDPVVSGDLIYPSITSLAGIKEANDHVFIKVDKFEHAYADLKIVGAQQLHLNSGQTPVLRVHFQYQGKANYAYAYGLLPNTVRDDRIAVLVIPGSGQNQSAAIAGGDRTNYQIGIIDALDLINVRDRFTFIKPNESALALHNGIGRKLSPNFIVNYHLNGGGSYSVSYLVQSMAMMKFLQSRYQRSAVAGLSQGGLAAFLNALQSKPEVAVIASGYSSLMSVVEHSGHDQIIGVPGHTKLFDSSCIIPMLRQTPTRFLFTYGRQEKGVYRIEVDEQLSAKLFNQLANVEFIYHDAGHAYPAAEIADYLSRQCGIAPQRP